MSLNCSRAGHTVHGVISAMFPINSKLCESESQSSPLSVFQEMNSSDHLNSELCQLIVCRLDLPILSFFQFLPHKSSDNFMTFLSLRKKHGRGACMLLPQGSQPKLHLFSPHPEPYFSSLDVHDVFVQTERGKQIPTLGESIHASATTVQHWYCMSSDHIFWHVRNSSSHPLKTPRQTVHIYCRPKLLSAQIKMSCTTHSLFKSYSATLTPVSSLTDAKAHICMKCRAAWLCEWDRTETMWSAR